MSRPTQPSTVALLSYPRYALRISLRTRRTTWPMDPHNILLCPFAHAAVASNYRADYSVAAGGIDSDLSGAHFDVGSLSVGLAEYIGSDS